MAALCGAGLGAESGLPTFRDAPAGAEAALWAQYRPEALATPQAFRRDPRLVWAWYTWRRERALQAVPNSGHYALAQLADRFPDFTLIPQNVDGLQQRAGSRHVLELHGSLLRARCSQCAAPGPWADAPEPPRCAVCGGLLRPDVVWFGESLPQATWAAARAAAQRAEVFLTIGTSGLVAPAASLPLEALAAGAALIEINPQPTPLSGRAHLSLRGPAGELLPQLT